MLKCVNNTTKEYDERYKSTDTVGTTGDGIVMAQKLERNYKIWNTSKHTQSQIRRLV